MPAERVLRALVTGLRRAASEEKLDLQEVSCERDYSRACPLGWIDMDQKCQLNDRVVSFNGMTPWRAMLGVTRGVGQMTCFVFAGDGAVCGNGGNGFRHF